MSNSIDDRLFIQKNEIVSKYIGELLFDVSKSKVYESKLNEITYSITSNNTTINDLTPKNHSTN